VAGVVIGIDPHKGSHTAVALDVHEKQLGRLRVRASSRQVDGLLEWASGWPRRRWAIEGARGLGQLLAQQLIASGERVLDVPPKLAARVRLLDSGQINKNDLTTRGRSRSPRCAPMSYSSLPPRTTRW
jgi:transposase